MNLDSIEYGTERLGAWPLESGGVRYRVWAPKAGQVELVLMGQADGKGQTEKRTVLMKEADRGYFETVLADSKEGDRYYFKLDGGKEIPDPASRFQPEGVHGPSQVLSPRFTWTDSSWKGLPLEQLVIYELHVGTFTKEGTFAGVAERLGHLKDLGVNAIEIMPVAQFAGARNWGYDGVGLFATQNSYGGPVELKKLVDRCHKEGIAVFLDVVYNHLGPEGNYLSQFGPYFQSKYHTPWGDAINYDGERSDEVRRYFLENASQWLEEFHLDGLRLDAVHAIFDTSAKPFLEELGQLKRDLEVKLGRKMHLIAESDANDSRLLLPPNEGGLGMDGQWADDLHHEIHALLTGENQGYYADYGEVRQLAEAFKDGVIYDGEYSEFRQRSHGRPYRGIDRSRLVVCSQNHDQIGNRMTGDRLIKLVGPEKQMLAAACVFVSPYLPLMYMGEEIAETNPFLYFVDHSDPNLIEAVRKGRKEEFSGFLWQGEPPDPAAAETFERSKINWERVGKDETATRFTQYYRRLITISKWIRAGRLFEAENVRTQLFAAGKILEVAGSTGGKFVQAFFSFSSENQKVPVEMGQPALEIVLKSWDDSTFTAQGNQNDELRGLPLEGRSVEMPPWSVLVVKGSS